MYNEYVIWCIYLAKCPSKAYFSIWLMSFWSPNRFFWGKCDVTGHLFTRRYIDVFARLNWSDYMRQDTDCKVVLFLLTYLRMFSHVYFVLKLVLMWRRWSVHVRLSLPRLLNWIESVSSRKNENWLISRYLYFFTQPHCLLESIPHTFLVTVFVCKKAATLHVQKYGVGKILFLCFWKKTLKFSPRPHLFNQKYSKQLK